MDLLSPTRKWREQVRVFMFDTWQHLRDWLEQIVVKDKLVPDDWTTVTHGAREIYQGMIRPSFSILVTQNSHNMSHILTMGQNPRVDAGWLKEVVPHESGFDDKKFSREIMLERERGVHNWVERFGEFARDEKVMRDEKKQEEEEL